MRIDPNNDKSSATPSPASGTWALGLSAAAAALASVLDASVTEEDVVVLGKYAVPGSLLNETPEGNDYNPAADDTWSYSSAQKCALTRRAEAGVASGMTKPIKGVVAREIIEALVGFGAILHADKAGNSLSRVRSGVVALTLAVEGAEDCASNLSLAASEEQIPSITVPIPDSEERAKVLVPSGQISGPCIEWGAFKRLLRLLSATDKVSVKARAFQGLIRDANGYKVTQFVALADIMDAIVQMGVRTYAGHGEAQLVLPVANGNVIRAMPEAAREEARGLATKFVSAYREAVVEAIQTVLGGGKMRASVKAAEAVKTGAAYRALLIKAGQVGLAEGAQVHGHLAAITSNLSIED